MVLLLLRLVLPKSAEEASRCRLLLLLVLSRLSPKQAAPARRGLLLRRALSESTEQASSRSRLARLLLPLRLGLVLSRLPEASEESSSAGASCWSRGARCGLGGR